MSFRFEVPRYRVKQLREALGKYELPYGVSEYSLKEHTWPTPDKEFYFFTNTHDDTVLVFLVEDYISGWNYVRECFGKEISATLVTVHRLKSAKLDAIFDNHGIYDMGSEVVGEDDGWPDGVNKRDYAIDFAPYYTGFMATVKPIDAENFWRELPSTTA